MAARILTTMRITEHVLRRAWHRTAAGSDLLDDIMLPPTGTSPDQYAQRVAEPGGLFLVLDETGTVRGHRNPYHEVFATQDLDQALYFAAEDTVRRLAEHIVARSPGRGPAANLVTGQAGLLDRIDPAWGDRFRSGGVTGTETGTARPCGRDPLERLAWIADTWRDQAPYTHFAFFRGDDVSAEEIALLHGADPVQVAAGTRLSDLCDTDGSGRDLGEIPWETLCFGQEGDWTYLLHHDTPPGTRADSEALAGLGVRDTVLLSACSAKAIYTFEHTRDGERVADDAGAIELIRYDRGRAPFYRGGRLDFLNQAIRRAELDHPELTYEFELFFHALDTALGLRLPERDLKEGKVRAARWAGAGGR